MQDPRQMFQDRVRKVDGGKTKGKGKDNGKKGGKGKAKVKRMVRSPRELQHQMLGMRDLAPSIRLVDS